jgi:S-adenosylmethionine/arginine decarboxylase-like enzyme
MAIDLYTCGTATSTDKAAEFLKKKLKSTHQEQKDLVRNSVREETAS